MTYRISAGTVSPVFSSIRSPGTTSIVGIVTVFPSRAAVAVGEDKDRSESIVFSALYSCTKPITTLSRMMAVTTPPSIHDLIANETAMAAIRICVGLVFTVSGSQ